MSSKVLVEITLLRSLPSRAIKLRVSSGKARANEATAACSVKTSMIYKRENLRFKK